MDGSISGVAGWRFTTYYNMLQKSSRCCGCWAMCDSHGVVPYGWLTRRWQCDGSRLRGEIPKFGSLAMVAGRAMLKAAQP